MMNPGRRQVVSQLSTLVVALTALFSAGLGPAPEAHAQVSSLPLDFSDVVIFATNSVRLDNNARINSGHVVVNNASAGPTLSPGFELGIGSGARTPAGYAIVGDSISNSGIVGGNAFYNTLNNTGTISGTLNTPLSLPVFAPLPTFKSAPAGSQDVTVPRNAVQTLAPGDYRDITIQRGGTLKFSPGIYNVRSITGEQNANLLFENLSSGTSEVRVVNRVSMDNGVVGPSDGDPLKAGKIVFYVAFAPPPGTLTPAALAIDGSGTIKANVYAPNGTVTFGNDSRATGAFLARDIDIASNARVDLETFFITQAPAITSANTATFIVGQAGSFTVTATGFPAPSITQTGALPNGVTFVDNGNGTGTLSGTPAAGTAGTYALTFTASNGTPPDAVQSFTLNVHQPPTITSPNATTFTVGVAGSFTVTTSGFPTPSITQTGALPSGVTFVNNGNGTGTLSGTPAAGTGGTYAITFTATNAAGSSPTQNFMLTVNEAPTITSANATTFVVGQAGSFAVTTTGSPTPSITRGGVALPGGVTFVDNGNGTGTLSGTPATGTGGVYLLSFTASNGVSPDAVQDPFTLTVNERPTAVDDGPYLTDANTSFSRVTADPDDLLDNDSRGFPQASITSFGGGSLGGTVTSNAADTTVNFGTGSLIVQSDGAFTFVPVTGFTGAFTFQYRLTNSGGTSDATVTIHVRPKAVSETFAQVVLGNVIVNTAAGTVFSVLFNDVFNGAASAALVSATSTAGGDVALNASSGTFTYNPPVGYQGGDSFSYTVTDSSGFTSAPATVTLTVNGMIWFVNNNTGACSALCNGRLTNPFTTLQAFTSVNDGVGFHPANNQNIFVYESATPYTFTSGTLLRPGQKLFGQDATAPLATIAGVTVPSGSVLPAMNSGNATATTLGSTVTLAASSTVRGLTISTGAAPGLNDPTAAITGVAVSEVRVATTTGTAVNLSDAAGTLSFVSVSSNGAPNGIVLANTTGSFAVTGTGAANTGGTIQSSTGDGIRLNGAQSVSLTGMRVVSSGDNNVDATNVTGLTLSGFTSDQSAGTGFLGTGIRDLTISNGSLFDRSGSAAGQHGIFITELLGTSSITNTTVRRSAESQIKIRNTTSTVAAPATPQDVLTLSGLTVDTVGSAFFGDAVQLTAETASANARLVVDNSAAGNTISDGIAGIQVNALSGSRMDVSISNVTRNNGTGTGFNMNPTGAGTTLTFNIARNTISNTGSIPINATTIGGATISGAIGGPTAADGNTISGSANASGIVVIGSGTGTANSSNVTVAVRHNSVSGVGNGSGIRAQARVGSTMNLTLTDNTVNNDAALNLEGLNVEVGSSVAADTANSICLNMANNHSTVGPTSGQEDYRLTVRSTNAFRLQDFVGNGAIAADVTDWVTTTKDNTKADGISTPTVQVSLLSGGVFTSSAGACQLP